ncbi:MAG: glycosyl hydrolase [Candidatus Beckwithbacteria bacterium]|nr:glycosyl hydrolase [Candidatus Beckwithbacteria bacterium]
MRNFKTWVGLLILVGGLIIALSLGRRATRLLPGAAGQPANIIVKADESVGPLPRPWTNLAQGGEESTGMLSQTVGKIKPLKPTYIRLDHIYDFYDTIKKENGQLNFNWTKLDKEIEAILQTGAKPFLSLSYLPQGFGLNDWQAIVKATINHYSGKNEKNLTDVYYEVWNEPDLFGDWKISGEKNYLDLYRLAAVGADQITNANLFKLGGPATTGMYRNWMEALFNLIDKESLRLDFISWHRYGLNPSDFSADTDEISNLIGQYPKLIKAERIVSEWGFDPKNNSGYDSAFGAAHILASVREMFNRIQKAFLFEIKDGKDPKGQPFWGRWGLLTHESTGLLIKPRYNMLLWLNDLGTNRLLLSGENGFIRGIAAKKENDIQIYLVNYDPANQHEETVPIIVKNLPLGQYQVTTEWFGQKPETKIITITAGTYVDSVNLKPNQSTRVSLTPNNR